MGKKVRLSPIQQRKNQISSELKRLQLPKNRKKRTDFKSEESFHSWKTKLAQKLQELSDESVMLESPGLYNEIPLATAAEELGMSLSEIIGAVNAGLVEISFQGYFPAGRRISREELGRLEDLGGDELLRKANQNIEEVFSENVQHLHAGDVEAAKCAVERLERFQDWCNPYFTCYEIGLALISGDLGNLKYLMEFVGRQDPDEIAVHLPILRSTVEPINPSNPETAVFREQILAVATGFKTAPFDQSYRSYESSEYFSKMDENQRHAMFLSNVIFDAVQKYRLAKEWERVRGWQSASKQEELERVVRNAIYTALEAEDNYYSSPTSKLFVDKFVELFPKRWIPAQTIALLPRK